MKARYLTAAALIAILSGWLVLSNLQLSDTATAAEGAKKMLIVHNVYFKLKDPTAAAKQTMLDACNKYLTKHTGEVFFACGTCSDLDRPVNDRDWDIGLHIVFQDRAAHDKYQVDERHLKFIDENKASWEKVRVFDSDCAPAGK